MRTYASLAVLLFSISAVSQECTNTFSAKVIDLHDDTALVGATVVLAGTEQFYRTDENGSFTIADLCDQTYSFQVSHPYCLTKGFTVTISGNTKKIFGLEHHVEELNEVMLQGKAFGQKSNTVLENTISKDEIDRYSSGSLGDALNNISGVSSLNTGNTVVKPLINGLHSSRVVIINNGVRMEDQEWGSEHAPNIDINSAGNITLIKGAGTLQYSGNAIGGVIVSEASKVPVKDSLYGKTLLALGSNGRGGSLTSQLTKSFKNGLFITAQGTLKRFGDFEAPDYLLSNTGLFERNASFNLGLNKYNYGFEAYYSFYKNDIGILSASHLGGAQDQIRAINSDRPLIVNPFTYKVNHPKQEATHQLARLKVYKRFHGLGKLSLQYDFQKNDRLEFDIRRGDNSDNAAVDLKLATHTLMTDFDTKLWETVTFKTGLMARYQVNFANPDTGVRRLIPDYDKYEAGIYAIADYQLNEQLLLEAGGRFDYTFMDVYKFYRESFWEQRNYDTLFPELVIEEASNQVLTNPQLKFNNPSATVGATYSFTNKYKLFFNYSLASRAPNPSELFSEGLHHSASRIELGDLRFNSEIANKFSLTFQREDETFGFAIGPFINSIRDFIVIEPTGIQQTVRGNFQVWEYRQTNAQLLGFDLDASLAFDRHFRFNSQFSFVKGYDRSKEEPLINMPPVSTKNELVYENTALKNLRLALQSNYVFRQNEYPNTNFEVFIPETGRTETVDISTPPNAYQLLNFNSSIDFKMNNKSTLTVGFNVSNVFNTKYRNYLNRLRYYADDLGRNFLVNLKINY